MIVELAAGVLLLALLSCLFRVAMGLRFGKIAREESRRALESAGRRVVAEIPTAEGDLVFFLEDAEGFYWGAEQARKSTVAGARMLLNGVAVGELSDGGPLPSPPPFPPSPPLPRSPPLPGPPSLPPSPPAEDYDGQERWDVVLYLTGGHSVVVPCGRLHEGVSREIATQVFEAVRRALGRRA